MRDNPVPEASTPARGPRAGASSAGVPGRQPATGGLGRQPAPELPADACCAECAAAADHAITARPEVIQVRPLAAGRVSLTRPASGISRSIDREITFGGLVLAATFLAMAAIALLLPAASRLGAWVPLHLALAGAASTAIAAMLPFFSVTLAAARPARPAVRIAGIGLVAAGAVAVIAIRDLGAGGALGITIAGGSFLAGLGFVAVAAFVPLRGALGVRRALVERAYAVALANVAIGVTLAVLMLAGNEAIGARWGSLKPAHAWLNLVGFAGLVIVASVIHLAPTVAGSRIRPRRSSLVAVVALAVGPPIIAVGYGAAAGIVVQSGMLVILAGAIALIAHALGVHLDDQRGRWTTNLGWHHLTSGALLGGQAWIGVGLALGAARGFSHGADPTGWSIDTLVGPFVVGGVVQTLIGAASHLVPAIGPGGPVRHAAQREILGRAAAIRLVTINLGAALVTAGNVIGPGNGQIESGSVAAGLAIAALGVAGSLALLGAAALPEGVTAGYLAPGSDSSGGG